jgi:hypothetical protein
VVWQEATETDPEVLFIKTSLFRAKFDSASHPPSFLDGLGSELWYRFGCRAADLASGSTLAVGSFSPRGVRSKGDQLEHLWCRYRDSHHPCPARKEDS